MAKISTTQTTKVERNAFALVSLVQILAVVLKKGTTMIAAHGQKAIEQGYQALTSIAQMPALYPAVHLNNGSNFSSEQSFCRSDWKRSHNSIRGGNPGRHG